MASCSIDRAIIVSNSWINRLDRLRLITEKVDHESTVAGAAAGMTEVRLPIRWPRADSPGGEWVDGRVTGIGQRVAEPEDAAVALQVVPAAGVPIGSGIPSNQKDEENCHAQTRYGCHCECASAGVSLCKG
jgi:hypothetical protein